MEELEMTQATSNDKNTNEQTEDTESVINSESKEAIENATIPSVIEEEQNEDIATVDYGEVERQDLEELHALFPHLRDKTSIMELDNPLRYAALRDLGLSAKEAYLATSEPVRKYDNRSHLRSSVPKSAAMPQNTLTRGELEAARELFSGLSDREIQQLYTKVSR